jgi:hypothetical protein
MSQDSLIKMPFPCVVCDQEVRPRHHALECESCFLWQHRLGNTGESEQKLTSWSQTTQGNGILINESCDIAPLFIHTHQKIKEFLKVSILLLLFSQYAQVGKSLGQSGSYESM